MADYNYIVNINNTYYIKSEYVKVYPSAYRGTYEVTEKIEGIDKTKKYPINPEALLYSEFNVTTSVGNIGMKQNYIPANTISFGKTGAVTNWQPIVIKGYLFLIDTRAYNELPKPTQESEQNKVKYANIKLEDKILAQEATPNSTTDYRDAKTKLLVTQYSTNGGGTDQTLDTKVGDDTIFTGLTFTTTKKSDAGIISFNFTDENAQYSIGKDNLDKESITAEKLDKDLINKGSDEKNGMKVTLSQDQAETTPITPHKFNINLEGTHVENALYLVDASDVAYTIGELTANTSADIVYFENGIPTVLDSGTVGSTSNPVYIDGGKIIPITETITNYDTTNETYQPLELINGTFKLNTTSTAAVGSGTNPIYMENGKFKASAETIGEIDEAEEINTAQYTPLTLQNGELKKVSKIGSNKKIIYIDNDGKITESTEGVGTNGYTLIYLNNGELTESEQTVGTTDNTDDTEKATKLVYLGSGKIKTSTADVGNSTKPVYLAGGKITAFTTTQYPKQLQIANTKVTNGDIWTTSNNNINIGLANNLSFASNTLKVNNASSTVIGAIRLGYTTNRGTRKFKVETTTNDPNNDAYVNVDFKDYIGSTNIDIAATSNANIDKISLNPNLTDLASITCSGQIQGYSFYATSDARLKENIKPFEYRESILDLPIYNYDFKQGDKNQVGCLAQDLQKLYPELVNESASGYLSIQESKLVYLLMEEVKQLKTRIEELEKNK